MKCTSEKYNGWANYETWLFNLHYENVFTNDAQRLIQENCGDTDIATSKLAEYMENYYYEREQTGADSLTGFMADIVRSAINWVDFYEIASHYIDNTDYEKED